MQLHEQFATKVSLPIENCVHNVFFSVQICQCPSTKLPTKISLRLSLNKSSSSLSNIFSNSYNFLRSFYIFTLFNCFGTENLFARDSVFPDFVISDSRHLCRRKFRSQEKRSPAKVQFWSQKKKIKSTKTLVKPM